MAMKDNSENTVLSHVKIEEKNEVKHIITFENDVMPYDNEILEHPFIQELIKDKLHFLKPTKDLKTIRLSIYNQEQQSI